MRPAWSPRACATTAPTSSGSWSPISSRSAPSCSRARPTRSASPASSSSSTRRAAGRRDHAGWERRYLSRLSGTLIDGAVIVTPTVIDAHYGAPIVAVDPHTGRFEPADDRVRQPARRPARHRASARARPSPDRDADRPSATCSRRGCASRATAKAMAAAGVAPDERLVRRGRLRRAGVAASTRASCSPARPADRGVRRQRPVGDRDDRGRPRARRGRARRPVRRRLRQHPRVGAVRSAADHVQQPIRAMGQHASRLLIRLIRGSDRPDHVTLDAVARELVVPPRTTRAP